MSELKYPCNGCPRGGELCKVDCGEFQEYLEQVEIKPAPLEHPCDNCSHKGTRGEPCLTCPKPKLFEAEMKARENEYVNDNPDSKRLKTILVIKSVEKLNVADDHSGIELNLGYEFDVDGPLPEVADGIAKMAKELNHMEGLPENSGAYFIELIRQFYEKEVNGNEAE